MIGHNPHRTSNSTLIDPAYLATGSIPPNLPLHRGRIVFLWQTPSPQTIDYIRQRYPDTPILIGRYDVETPMCDCGLPYTSPADFFSMRALIDMEASTYDARMAYQGPPIPTYLSMPLIDGDLARLRVWHERVACAAMLLIIQQNAPHMEVITDWMGAHLTRSVGLRTQQLWPANLTDPHWPPRRWLRDRTNNLSQAINSRAPTHVPLSNPPANNNPTSNYAPNDTDVAVFLGGWVEQRFLQSFPIDLLTHQGYRCLLWVHRRTSALDELINQTNARCEQVDYPKPATNTKALEKRVANWCEQAIDANYFAPLKGALARRLVHLMGWPRWAPKLVAMHQRITDLLEKERPKLLLAPAEKDWGPYCALHAAQHLSIPSVGIKHASWMAGSDFDKLERGFYFPTAATHILAYTPGDAEVCNKIPDVPANTVVWQGNPRIDKSQVPPIPTLLENEQVRILVGARGIGPGRAIYLRQSVIPWNTKFIEALLERLGDRLAVRLHPWDSPANYPKLFAPRFLPPDQKLEDQLANCAAVATTYSTIAWDAVAAGRPVFLWDHQDLNLNRSEIALAAGAIVSQNLNDVCDALLRFAEDPTDRQSQCLRAASFAPYLQNRLPNASKTMSTQLVQFLSDMTNKPPTNNGAHHARAKPQPRQLVAAE